MSNQSGLTFGKVLGQGAFGNVIEGNYNGKDVAIKILHSPIPEECCQMLDFFITLKHRSVARLLAHVGPQLIFLKASRGNLLEYVKGIEDNALESLKKGMLNKFAIDIINGMEYLHEMNIVHGNLAARNILIHQYGDYLNAIVSDYGINQLVEGQGSNYFKRKQGRSIPIRWMPYESISANQYDGEITFASDVWSFGIVLWESWTKGDIPYGAATSNTEVRQLVLNGSSPLTLFRPSCPINVANVMERIFKKNPGERPTFSELGKAFQEIKNLHRRKRAPEVVENSQNFQERTSRRSTGSHVHNEMDGVKTRTSRSKSQIRQNSVPGIQHQVNTARRSVVISGGQTNTNNQYFGGCQQPFSTAGHVPEAPPPYTPSNLVPIPPLMDYAGAVPLAYSASTNMEIEMQRKVMDLKQQISNLEIKKLEQQVQSLQETVEADKRQGGSKQPNRQKNQNRSQSQHRNQQRYNPQKNKNQHEEHKSEDCSIV